MKSAVVREVMSLENKTLLELKAIWKRLFESDAPPYCRKYLIKRIAYHLQEIAYMSDKARKKLTYLCDQLEQSKKISSSTII